MEMVLQSIPIPMAQTIALTIAGLTGYLVACRRMRYVRSRAYSARYAGQTREELYRNMKLADAEGVVHAMARYEFPRIYTTSLQFALFRVCSSFRVCACACVGWLWLTLCGWLVPCGW